MKIQEKYYIKTTRPEVEIYQENDNIKNNPGGVIPSHSVP
jgi:hypothetical protein